MDPILLIIKYLFNKKNIDNNDVSIEAFFENGVSFPQFIALIFDVDEIPKIKKEPKTLFHKKMNNDVALQFLLQKNEFIRKINPSYNNQRDQYNLLLLILTKQCFNANINEIIAQCNSIVQPLNIQYSKKSDIINAKCILSILHVLTDGKVQIDENSYQNKTFDEIMDFCFKQANAPLVINKSSMDLQNQNIFLIQLEILFDFYSEKVAQLNNSPVKPVIGQTQSQVKPENKETIKPEDKVKDKPEDKQKVKPENKETIKPEDKQKVKPENNETIKPEDEQNVKLEDKKIAIQDDKDKIITSNNEQEEEEEIEYEFNLEEENIIEDKDDYKKIDQKIKRKKKKKSEYSSDYSSDSDDIDREERLEDALLKALNVIGKGRFHFNNFHDAVINDSIPKYVMFLLNIQSIKNVHINRSKKSITTPQKEQKDQKITKEELDNIQAVIEFLKNKDTTFQILKLDFSNPLTESSSAFMLYSNLLNIFYLKKTKKEMYHRCAILLCTKNFDEDENDFTEFTRIRTFSLLVYLIVNKNLHIKYRDVPSEERPVSELFQKANIPMIISEKIMDYTYSNFISDIVFYQMQFILDAFESGPKCLQIIEFFLYAIYHINKINVPKYESLAASIRAKKTSLEFQQARSDQYLNRTSSQSISESFSSGEITPLKKSKKVINPPKTYKERRQESNKSQILKQDNVNKSAKTNEIESFDSFWNKSNPNFGYDNGIMYNKFQHQHSRIKTQQEWMNEIEDIQKSIQNKDKKSDENKDEQQTISFKNSQSSFTSKLYKLFYYDESNKTWIFDSTVFEQFSNDKKINFEESITPVVLIINSFEKDSISLTSNLISGLYPNFDSEADNQIIVYGFCDKSLAMLNFHIDFTDKLKASIKPIFLLIHVPKSKENLSNLQSIILQINLFLSYICDLEIVILNKEYYLEQIELTKAVKTICKSVHKIKDFNSKSSDSSSSSDDNDDKKNEEEEEEVFEEEDKKDNETTNANIKNINIESFVLEAQKAKELLSNIRSNDYKILFLINDDTIQFSDDIENKINENIFFKGIKLQFDEDNAFTHYINIKDTETYKAFLSNFNDFAFLSTTEFNHLKSNFQCIDLFKLSPIYSQLRCKTNTWKEELKKIIMKRYSEIELSQIEKGNSFIIISNLKQEITAVIPSFDDEFNNEINSILAEIKSEGNKKNRDLFESEIKISSQIYLDYLKEKINSKFYWTEEQMDLMLNTYIDFLKEEFFDIIQLNSTEQIYNMIYEDNYDIVENQIKNDKIKIQELFKAFIDKINTKKIPKEQDIKEDIQKGTNYAMKETENLREIKVTVQINQDLKSEIEQDF